MILLHVQVKKKTRISTISLFSKDDDKMCEKNWQIIRQRNFFDDFDLFSQDNNHIIQDT